MKKKIVQKMCVTLLAVGMAMSLAACGSKAASDQAASETAAADSGAVSNGYYDYGDLKMEEVAVEEEVAEDDAEISTTTEAPAEGGMSDNSGTGQQQSSEKIIYTYNYSVETKSFDEFMNMIQKRTLEYGGYVESSEVSGNQEMGINRYSYMVLRIPADKMHGFLDMVKTNSNVTHSNSSTDNVTLTYVDLESHLKALRVEQESLLSLLEKAEAVEDIIRLQEQLTNVRYEIESYASQLRTFDNRINYSTLYLDINEVQRETTVATKLTYGEEISQGLSDTFYHLGQNFREASIWFIVNLPVIIVWIAVLLLIFVVVRAISKRTAQKKAKKAQEKEAPAVTPLSGTEQKDTEK